MIKGWKNSPAWREHFAAVRQKRIAPVDWAARLNAINEQSDFAGLDVVRPGGIIKTPAPKKRWHL